jgi:hypothetical protein
MAVEAHRAWQQAKQKAESLSKGNKDAATRTKKVLNGFKLNLGNTIEKMQASYTKAGRAQVLKKPAKVNQYDADLKRYAKAAVDILERYKAMVAAEEKKGSTPGLKWLHDDGIPKAAEKFKKYTSAGHMADWPDLDAEEKKFEASLPREWATWSDEQVNKSIESI